MLSNLQVQYLLSLKFSCADEPKCTMREDSKSEDDCADIVIIILISYYIFQSGPVSSYNQDSQLCISYHSSGCQSVHVHNIMIQWIMCCGLTY